ncbi:hypothetical protein ACUNV4_10355 [Granulosicoccus sp. 3-233]|uniref:hypothetical protein n=1 Tax=Granulosicoccus sp. 3-233 TaxID=3417969 RepID=UPI003D34C0B1
MSAVAKIRESGFKVRLVPPDHIGITPIESLTNEQRHWIVLHRNDVLSELRKEAANQKTGIAADTRWLSFVSMAIAHGVTRCEVAAQFTHEDIADLLEEPDDKLAAHALTVAQSIKCRHRPTEARLAVEVLTSDTPNLLKAIHRKTLVKTCGDCKHFVRNNHPHLGLCRIEAQPKAPGGFWDTDNRNYCDDWIMKDAVK